MFTSAQPSLQTPTWRRLLVYPLPILEDMQKIKTKCTMMAFLLPMLISKSFMLENPPNGSYDAEDKNNLYNQGHSVPTRSY